MVEQNMDESPNLIEEANKTASRLEKANEELKALLERQERNRSIDVISGRSSAGEVKKEITPQERKKLEAIEFFKGSEIEEAIKRYG